MEDPNNSLDSLTRDKGNKKPSQSKIIFEYLFENIATSSMVSDATGIKQKNICRRKRELEKRGLLWEVERKLCEVTGCRASYLTTNPDFAPTHEDQLKLF